MLQFVIKHYWSLSTMKSAVRKKAYNPRLYPVWGLFFSIFSILLMSWRNGKVFPEGRVLQNRVLSYFFVVLLVVVIVALVAFIVSLYFVLLDVRGKPSDVGAFLHPMVFLAAANIVLVWYYSARHVPYEKRLFDTATTTGKVRIVRIPVLPIVLGPIGWFMFLFVLAGLSLSSLPW